MNINFKCPYCRQNKYSKSSNKSGKFPNWEIVRRHVSSCLHNNGKYYIDLNEGPINIEEYSNLTIKQLKNKYPNLKSNITTISMSFKKRFPDIELYRRNWTEEKIIEAIQNFYAENGKIPEFRDFFNNKNYPGSTSVIRYFGTWNNAIKSAGYKPNLQNGFGIDTYGLDGHLYRSRSEAEFCNKFLYKKYDYIIEPKYPKPYNKWYDWYLPKLDIYIELDGNCRPEVIKEKIELNKKLKRKLLIIKTSNINKYTTLNEKIQNENTKTSQ